MQAPSSDHEGVESFLLLNLRVRGRNRQVALALKESGCQLADRFRLEVELEVEVPRDDKKVLGEAFLGAHIGHAEVAVVSLKLEATEGFSAIMAGFDVGSNNALKELLYSLGGVLFAAEDVRILVLFQAL